MSIVCLALAPTFLAPLPFSLSATGGLSISTSGGHACAVTTCLRSGPFLIARLLRAEAACSLATDVPPKERSITSGSTCSVQTAQRVFSGALCAPTAHWELCTV